MKFVLDAWAFLAYLQAEKPACERVAEIFLLAEKGDAAVFASWINLGEVYYIVGRKLGQAAARETLQEIRLLPVRLLSPDAQSIVAAADFKMFHTLSYADAFAIVAARQQEATLLTGDPEILALPDLVPLETLDRNGIE